MPKKIISDVVVDRKRGARSELLDSDQPKPSFLSRRKKMPQARLVEIPKRRRFGYLWWIIGLLIVILLFWFGTKVFASVSVSVYPETKLIPIDGTFSIYRDGDGSVSPSFKVIEISSESSTTVPANGTKNVERKATGMITVYNEYSSAKVNLIKNTRFESPTGKIYRVLNAISIPGSRVENGKTVPGTIDIEVYADEPGAEYNTGIVNFTIPGLKDTPRYTKVYAKGKTEITGGLKGRVYQVSDDDRNVAEQELKSIIEKDLMNNLSAQIPAGYTLLSDATTIIYDPVKEETPELITEQTENKTATFSQTGRVYGILLNIEEFSKVIAERYLEAGQYSGESVVISNMDELIFDVLDTANLDPENAPTISVDIVGSALLVWQYDKKKLVSDLLGVKKNEYIQVLENYPSIMSATTVLSPRWIRTFPTKPEKIKIEEVIGVGE